ncbi:drug/metabolite transporter (DMT)-like permease [Microbacterium testaceum]|nr:drug/metabolite transporter (DMT)-like permease [Microbacterium testaceum]
MMKNDAVVLPGCLPHAGGVTRRTPEILVDVLLIAVAAVWGASFLAAKDLAAETGVAAAVSLRFLVAALALGIICLVRRERMPRGRGLAIAALLGCSQAAVIGLETAGVHLTSATNAGLLISLALVFTPVLESVAARAWLPRSYFVAAVAAIVGVALLVSGGGLRTPSIGDALVIAAAVVRAVHVTASARLTRGRHDSTLAVVFVQMVVCAATSSAVAGAQLPRAVAGLTASGWLDVVFLGLMCSVFAFVVQLWAVRRTSATRASILMGTEPVWALAVGVAIGGEAVGLPGYLGAALIIAASYAGQAIERRHRRSVAAVAVATLAPAGPQAPTPETAAVVGPPPP